MYMVMIINVVSINGGAALHVLLIFTWVQRNS